MLWKSYAILSIMAAWQTCLVLFPVTACAVAIDSVLQVATPTEITIAITTSVVVARAAPQITSAPDINTAFTCTFIDQVPLYNTGLKVCARNVLDYVVRTQSDGCGAKVSTGCFCITSSTQMLASITSRVSKSCGGGAEDIALATSCFNSYCVGAVGPRTAAAVPPIDVTQSLSTTILPSPKTPSTFITSPSTSYAPSMSDTPSASSSVFSSTGQSSSASEPAPSSSTFSSSSVSSSMSTKYDGISSPSTSAPPTISSTPPNNVSSDKGLSRDEWIAIGFGIATILVSIIGLLGNFVRTKLRSKRIHRAKQAMIAGSSLASLSPVPASNSSRPNTPPASTSATPPSPPSSTPAPPPPPASAPSGSAIPAPPERAYTLNFNFNQ